ncbi:rhamnogalacturonyl hydrolase YesR [Streptomyces sp. SAI-135]|uniref:glycoside hydrolase family 76 protein n=1 Tax=unclassified Streptomyces TaxID=2593676 RepID=UPI0024760344|nr:MULTISPECIES: glycoside hydrolase family 76 protein [unclassified Streptomyces]MDH6523061.1 rhamnogalacturonyl hydrolase YesR [Streptomyces sp. SAI-090]MDH6554674.1 rhamnogalacturonyl hydrolase YesR [Streptomyces sp. SAI-041]MDH6573944.1 rhamnogalacturonyl hydrolase YesR [Streptomyces sp. SAI-117]MDH6581319.1 rhamnogalacturonyl hydrolase YesR [Streptomyces sp. SAI-133]MDH6613326.1 rhamnogalacturonyl hydrolase YesR [Streptomyces sp. SAI-135]
MSARRQRTWIGFLVMALALATLIALPTPSYAAPAVCALACDTLDPANARQDTFPVPDRNLNGRVLRLHVSDADNMAWASIDKGVPGDSVWLDRSWDRGASWEPLLGKAGIPGTWTGTRTLMFNISDPVGHRRGWIRACGDAAAVGCTDWVYPRVCDATACDGADPATASGDDTPVPSTALFGRTISLHVDQRNGMAWGLIDSGGAGDEIWLDRSWDAGASWPEGSSLGRKSVSTGASSTRTAMFATRDPRGLLYGGAVRACGREAAHQEGACTAWARPAPTRARAAADALLASYHTNEGWWRSSWWNSAVALTSVVDFAEQAGRHDYDWVIARTFEQNRGVFPAGVRSSDPVEGHFISRAIDDAAWWAMAWIRAYDYTGERRYLDEAVTITDYVHRFWDPSTCGGGVWWDRERTYKNAVTNGLYLWLTTSLHQRVGGDTTWGERAATAADWYLASGMINSAGLVNDGLTNGCANNGQTVWSYNQGMAIGAFTQLWRSTGSGRYLDTARRLADAAISSPVLTRDGILTESCDIAQNSCDDNQKQFKGIFMRNLADLAKATGSAAYRTYIQRQADSMWAHDRDSLNRLGQRWSGSTPNPSDWRTQASALEALTAAESSMGREGARKIDRT